MEPFILIIENNTSHRELMGSLLELDGMDVRYASDAEAGLTILTKIRPALILVGLDLLKLNGQILAQVLKNDPDTNSLTVVALVGLDSSSDEYFDRSLSVFDGYIEIPFAKSSFAKRVKAFLKQSKTEKKQAVKQPL